MLLDIGDGKFSDKNEELLDIINIPEDIVCVNNIVNEIFGENPLTLAMTVLTPK